MSENGRNRIDRDFETEEERRARLRRKKRRKEQKRKRIMLLTTLLVILGVVLVVLILIPKKKGEGGQKAASGSSEASISTSEGASSSASSSSSQAAPKSDMVTLLSDADRLAKMYDYDKAIEMLQSSPYAAETEVKAMISTYEADKAELKDYDHSKITHIFFHSLIVDSDIAFKSSNSANYNSVMTTIPEFNEILKQMYEKGYVLVTMHDICTFDENGTLHKNPIMLPPGKIPFVMSQDDVCYYEYMEGQGFATRFVIGEDGRPTLEYKDKNGNVTTGDYDLVPILDHFVDEHPDFSYRGSKAILAFTGYNGILGYRTDETYDPNSPNYNPEKYRNENIENDRAMVKKITQALKDDGYEFASHSWGHIRTGDCTLERLKTDTDKWERNVEPLLPDPCPILIYPFGSDIGNWRPYAEDNEKFKVLYDAGFRYYLTVDSAQYWLQYNSNYMRGGRRNVDGYRLYQDLTGAQNRLGDILDVKKVFDTVRPTPVEQ